eukprot:CAMPEP_0113448436 /NCGR_PEP_ID=MMETSP0014_2-20120614/4766_1 /TAXON_ID=2857 /ORGANISM="Nitzschia sp." /LENGTH=207 /DNA_ID=CAMNT_0000339649 /DNA_START=120 /DNA_END=743 /DNA_ORIENTATION=- /assembly_acc=CAM_ASM_000159
MFFPVFRRYHTLAATAAAVFVALLVVAAVPFADAQLDCSVAAAPNCVVGDYCANSDPPGCSTFGCTADTGECKDAFDEVEPCDSQPSNVCGDSFCGEGLVSGCTCYADDSCQLNSCVTFQAINCPDSLSAGTCDESGASCPTDAGISCEKTENSFSASCPDPTDAPGPTDAPAPPSGGVSLSLLASTTSAATVAAATTFVVFAAMVA